MKFRAESIEAVHRMITMCYNEEPTIGRQLHGKFWALIESVNGGEIPEQCFLQLQQKLTLPVATAYNLETYTHGQASAPYRAGTGTFTAQFKPDKPYSATIAIETGVHGEYAAPIFFEQSSRRCLITLRLFETCDEYELSDEKAFWNVMREWANFDPRLARQRKNAGQLFYPAEYSHMFEQHWDFIQAPRVENAPSPTAGKYASAAAQLVFTGTPLVDSEAPDKSSRIARSGAMSRRYPVQDAQDYFSRPQEQAQEECVTVANGFAPGPDVHNVDTGPGDSVSSPT
jgi:hypothetical protein